MLKAGDGTARAASEAGRNKQSATHMKTRTSIITGLALSIALLGSVATQALAQDNTAAQCPMGRAGCGQGPAWNMTPEQRAEHVQQMQAYVAGLREKKANGSITAEEAAWLAKMEERGGLCVNGVPRGPRGGFGAQGQAGQGRGMGAGKGHRWGQGGAGNPNCPFANPQQAK